MDYNVCASRERKRLPWTTLPANQGPVDERFCLNGYSAARGSRYALLRFSLASHPTDNIKGEICT